MTDAKVQLGVLLSELRTSGRESDKALAQQIASLSAEIEADAIATQAAEISRLTAALKALYDDCIEYARINNLHNADGSPATNHAMRQAAALLRPQPQPAQAEPETPVLSREIEFAEVTTDETGTYLAIWENGVHHSFLIEDVFEAMTVAQSRYIAVETALINLFQACADLPLPEMDRMEKEINAASAAIRKATKP